METVAFLDTHILVWLYAGEVNLISKAARKLIEQIPLIVSPMALLEVDYLCEIKKITVGGRKLFEELRLVLPIEQANDPFGDIVAKASDLSCTKNPFYPLTNK